MNVTFTIKGDQSWQTYPAICDVTYTEIQLEGKGPCECCKSTANGITFSDIQKDIRSHGTSIEESYISTKIQNVLKKVYENRFLCENDICKTKFKNETMISFQRKGHRMM